MNFVADHVLQTLIVGGTQENHNLELLTSEPVIHHLIAVALVAQLMELRAHVINSLVLERCRVTFITVECGDLTQNALDQMTNGHTRGDSVRVDNHVGHEPLNSEWQILLTIRHTASTFLSVTRGKLVSDLRRLDGSHLYLNEALILIVGRQNDRIDVAFLGVLKRDRLVLELLLLALITLINAAFTVLENVIGCGRDRLSNNDVVTRYLVGWADNTIGV